MSPPYALTPADVDIYSLHILLSTRSLGAAFMMVARLLRAKLKGVSICTTGHPECNFACNNYGFSLPPQVIRLAGYQLLVLRMQAGS